MKRILVIPFVVLLTLGTISCSGLRGDKEETKPTKAEVLAAFKKANKDADEQSVKLYECIIDKAYKELTAKTLKYLTDPDNQNGNAQDAENAIDESQNRVLNDAANACITKYGNNPFTTPAVPST